MKITVTKKSLTLRRNSVRKKHRLRCPNPKCTAVYAVHKSDLGKSGRCRRCQKKISVTRTSARSKVSPRVLNVVRYQVIHIKVA